jgi:DNA-binding PadR family transcriptional regulator
MKEKDVLGQLEQLVLSAVLGLGKNAYPVPVHEAVTRMSAREVSHGSVYVTLERLEDKGYLVSRLGDPTPERGGRPKRFYRMLAAGERVLAESLKTSERMLQNTKPAWRFVKWQNEDQQTLENTGLEPATGESNS